MGILEPHARYHDRLVEGDVIALAAGGGVRP
jgi:hypothetical protein